MKGMLIGLRYCGGIVGLSWGITINNCINSGSISSPGWNCRGGILGSSRGSETTISNCGNRGTIGSVNDDASSGGVVGSFYKGVYAVSILNCYNLGEVFCKANCRRHFRKR